MSDLEIAARIAEITLQIVPATVSFMVECEYYMTFKFSDYLPRYDSILSTQRDLDMKSVLKN